MGNVAGQTDEIATQAHVLLIVSLVEYWKIPVGYFLVNGLSGEEKAHLIEVCLRKCHDEGVDVLIRTIGAAILALTALTSSGRECLSLYPYSAADCNATCKRRRKSLRRCNKSFTLKTAPNSFDGSLSILTLLKNSEKAETDKTAKFESLQINLEKHFSSEAAQYKA
ncbi:hypothetical protein EVAR_102833_1 [Eumeta japonica]|uniref:Transposable element P transposase-like RNase H domain-containing protein n=1 Tax=Eumeta variegata TaxID=151549 RepID=A0A4C1UMB2_EUMVA|nr:hypothetical protein EVAR_102833_1 [Eumeta japonica]